MTNSLLVFCFSLFIAPLVAYSSDYSKHALKIRCFHCNTPYPCESGTCYGDMCVKIVASNSYVVKGCENVTRSVTSELYDPQQKQRSYCRVDDILGVETTICYCKDGDYCNSSHMETFLPLTLLWILLVRL